MQKERLEIQIKFLEKNKFISVVGSNIFIINEKTLSAPPAVNLET